MVEENVEPTRKPGPPPIGTGVGAAADAVVGAPLIDPVGAVKAVAVEVVAGAAAGHKADEPVKPAPIEKAAPKPQESSYSPKF